MKPTKTLILLASLSGGISILAAQPSTSADVKSERPAPAAAKASETVSKALTAAAATGGSAGVEGLRMNFVDAPLDAVLNYLSEAAGFIIIKEVPASGRVNIVSQRPMTKDEAVNLLNSVLHKNGCAAIRNGRTLSIVRLDEVKTRGIPVSLWDGDPDSIPRADVVVTMVLPIRFVAVQELLANVMPLVSPTTPLTANQSGNSIIITDTQANIRRIAEIIRAVDGGAEDVTVVKIFTLKYANPEEIADELSTIFADSSSSGSGDVSAPMTFDANNASGSGGGSGPTMGAEGGTGASQNARVKARNHVVAVPDMRTGSIVVTASRDLMDNISNTVNALDEGAGDGHNQKIQIFTADNTDPADVLQAMQDLFNRNGGAGGGGSSALNSALKARQTSASSSRAGTGPRTGVSMSSPTGASGFGGGGGTSQGGGASGF